MCPLPLAVAALKKAHSDRLKVRFDSTEAEKDQEIDIITQQISERFNFAGAKLQRVVSKAQANKLDADSKIKKNIQRSVPLADLSARRFVCLPFVCVCGAHVCLCSCYASFFHHSLIRFLSLVTPQVARLQAAVAVAGVPRYPEGLPGAVEAV